MLCNKGQAKCFNLCCLWMKTEFLCLKSCQHKVCGGWITHQYRPLLSLVQFSWELKCQSAPPFILRNHHKNCFSSNGNLDYPLASRKEKEIREKSPAISLKLLELKLKKWVLSCNAFAIDKHPEDLKYQKLKWVILFLLVMMSMNIFKKWNLAAYLEKWKHSKCVTNQDPGKKECPWQAVSTTSSGFLVILSSSLKWTKEFAYTQSPGLHQWHTRALRTISWTWKHVFTTLPQALWYFLLLFCLAPVHRLMCWHENYSLFFFFFSTGML